MNHSVFDSFLDAVFVVDRRLVPLYCNEAAVTLTGLAARKLRGGDPFHKLIALEGTEPDATWITGAESATPYLETAFATSAARGRVQVSAQPDPEAPPEEPRWIVVLRDVTLEASLHVKYRTELGEKENTIVALNETRDQLIQSAKMTMLGQFIAGISHELNNPLAIALGSGQDLMFALEEDPVDMPEAREMSRYVFDACSRMMRLSHHLKMFVHTPLDQELFVLASIQDVVSGAVEFCRRITETSGIEVDWQLPENLPVFYMDPGQIEQILINLVKNSADALENRAMSEGLGRITIRGTHNEQHGTFTLSLEDNGPGIPAKVRERLFTPFFTTKEPGKGTGMGLSVSAMIAEKHGGTLTAAPAASGGATFLLTLPAGAEKPLELDDGEIRVRLRGLKAVVADDEPWILQRLRKILVEVGCEVVVAGDGLEALEACKRERPAFVITDLAMPRMNGIQLAEQLRKLHPSLKLILVTGSDNYGVSSAGQHLFDAKLTKPFVNRSVVDAVAKAIAPDLAARRKLAG